MTATVCSPTLQISDGLTEPVIPQGLGGTFWTAIGSNADSIASVSSTTQICTEPNWKFVIDGVFHGDIPSYVNAAPDGRPNPYNFVAGLFSSTWHNVPYSIHSGMNSNKCVDVRYMSTVPGTPVQTYDCGNTYAQVWGKSAGSLGHQHHRSRHVFWTGRITALRRERWCGYGPATVGRHSDGAPTTTGPSSMRACVWMPPEGVPPISRNSSSGRATAGTGRSGHFPSGKVRRRGLIGGSARRLGVVSAVRVGPGVVLQPLSVRLSSASYATTTEHPSRSCAPDRPRRPPATTPSAPSDSTLILWPKAQIMKCCDDLLRPPLRPGVGRTTDTRVPASVVHFEGAKF